MTEESHLEFDLDFLDSVTAKPPARPKSSDSDLASGKLDVFVYYTQEHVNNAEFCQRVSEVTGWDLNHTKNYLTKYNTGISFKEVTEGRTIELKNKLEPFKVRIEVKDHNPKLNENGAKLKSNRYSWLWWVAIIGFFILVQIFSASSTKSPSTTSPLTQQQSLRVKQINNYISSVSAVLEKKDNFEKDDKITNGSQQEFASIESKLQEIKMTSNTLKATYVPEEFLEGNKSMISGVDLYIAVCDKMSDQIRTGQKAEQSFVEEVSSELERANVLINQSTKELNSVIDVLKNSDKRN